MDTIDTSQWLRPRDMDARAEQIKGRTDLSMIYTENGRLQAILPAVQAILEYMDHREWLTATEVEAGRKFVVCRMAFQAQCGARTARYQAMTFAGASEAPGMTDDYRRLLREVGKRDFEIVAYVCDTACTPEKRDEVYANRGRIAEALGRVGKSLNGETSPRSTDTACA